MRWVGRPLRRYEDPILLQGRGRYSADLAQGARIVRFVRSPAAWGRVLTMNAHERATGTWVKERLNKVPGGG
jgi:aerobic carbon-monoxide dehydrogenase large subunit